MWKPLAIAIVVLVAACSPTSDPTTTTPTTETPETTATTTAPLETTVLQTTATTTTPPTTTTTTTTATTTTPPTATTTTTTAPTTTTTAPPVTTTTVTVPEGNEPPTIEIVSPEHLSSYTASFDTDRNDNGAMVELSAVVSDPNGDDVTVTWSSSVQGGLGTGESIVVFISTGGFDASQPTITATATDQWGASTSASVQIIVWIPSDT